MSKAKRSKKAKHLPGPLCNCVLLCDDVLISAKNKHFLQGIIGVIGLRELPAIIGGYVAYVRVSNVHGSSSVRVSLVRGETNQPVFAAEVNVKQPDPLGVHTVVSQVPPVAIEHAGRYLFQVECNGEILAMSPIEIVVLDALMPSQSGQERDS